MAVPKAAEGKPLALLIAVIVALTVASPAYATIFDSAHEPPTINNSGVTTETHVQFEGKEPSFYEFKVALSFGLTCPGEQPIAYTATFEDPSGSESVALAEPCKGTWQSPTGEISAGNVSGENGYMGPLSTTNPSASLTYYPRVVDVAETNKVPFLYQVTGPAGVVAQGAMTATVTPPTEINQRTEIDRFINTCIDGSHELKSKEGGNLYCEVGGSVAYSAGGWPAPSVPAAPEAPPAAEKPVALWEPLSLKTAEVWVWFALEHNFKYPPKTLVANHCKRERTGRYRCNVSWHHGPNAFAGWTEVGKLDVYTGAYKYGLSVVRTEVRTHRRRTFTVAYGRAARKT